MTTTFAQAMGLAFYEAKQSGYLLYVYQGEDDFIISAKYRKDWLFKAYPGGRRILSTDGKKLVETRGRGRKAKGNGKAGETDA